MTRLKSATLTMEPGDNIYVLPSTGSAWLRLPAISMRAIVQCTAGISVIVPSLLIFQIRQGHSRTTIAWNSCSSSSKHSDKNHQDRVASGVLYIVAGGAPDKAGQALLPLAAYRTSCTSSLPASCLSRHTVHPVHKKRRLGGRLVVVRCDLLPTIPGAHTVGARPAGAKERIGLLAAEVVHAVPGKFVGHVLHVAFHEPVVIRFVTHAQ